uniref:Rad21_Rec8 domain-containing protein n=1 Tax=Caenorhabditis tropicalis TaxID=1561998 RepID=A0A1I7T7E0_9PELO
MHRLMEDCSELHHRNTSVFLPTQRAKTPAKDLLQNVPFLFQKGCNKDLLELFQRRPTKYVAFNGVEEVEEEEEQAPRLETLEPIELSQLKFKQATLNPTPRESPVHRPEYAFDMEMVEQPRHEEPPVSSHEQIQNHGFMDDAILEEVRRDQYEEQTADRFSDRNGPRSSPPSNDKSAAEIRETMLAEMYSKSPFGIHLDSLLDLENSTAREAARTFYVALELLKERQIKVNQIDAFGPIDLWISGHDSEDLMELAESEMGDEDF